MSSDGNQVIVAVPARKTPLTDHGAENDDTNASAIDNKLENEFWRIKTNNAKFDR